MKFINDKGKNDWQITVDAQKDFYGQGVMTFAKRWADLMEKEIESGKNLKDIADKTSRQADTEGITGFMYGCAVGILSQTWIHGEDLRKWHNKDTQIGTEGDEANEKGGVLNPSMLCIGK